MLRLPRSAPVIVSVLALAVLACSDASHRPAGGFGFEFDAGPFSPPFTKDAGSVAQPNLFPPVLGETSVPAVRAPTIFGGTLLALADGTHVVAADPDRDQLYVVDLAAKKVTATVPTGAGSLPFRGIESAPGVVHFTLRGTGEVVTVDASTGAVQWRASACAEPRGITFDGVKQRLAVACEGGDIVSLAASGGAVVATLHTPVTSARDVFVEGEGFWISDFRTARLNRVDGNGTVVQTLGTSRPGGGTDFAWRTRRVDATTFVMSHQTTMLGAAIPTSTPGAYGGTVTNDCIPSASLVGVAVSVLRTNTVGEFYEVPSGTLPVDVAYRNGDVTLVMAGNSWQPAFRKVQTFQRGFGVPFECNPKPPVITGELVAAESTTLGTVVQSREPAVLELLGPNGVAASIDLSAVSRRDTGLILFHANSGRHVACASCHAEGADDAQVWTFQSGSTAAKRRRTPSLRGTIKGTAPYHWDGEEKDLQALFADVLVKRMDGPTLNAAQTEAFTSWIEALPAPVRSPTNDLATTRGAAVFAGKGKCSTCHGDGGAKPSNELFDVGTGGELGAPSLVGVSLRFPLMHDGCATTFADRFTPACGGWAHGGALTPSETSDVTAYLKSL